MWNNIILVIDSLKFGCLCNDYDDDDDNNNNNVSQCSLVGISTSCGLDDPGI